MKAARNGDNVSEEGLLHGGHVAGEPHEDGHQREKKAADRMKRIPFFAIYSGSCCFMILSTHDQPHIYCHIRADKYSTSGGNREMRKRIFCITQKCGFAAPIAVK